MILVVGAAGKLGGLVTQGLIEQGWEVRALLRRGQALSGVQPLYADLADPAAVLEACQGVDTVISTAGPAALGGDGGAAAVDRRGDSCLVDAARRRGVGRFIFVSTQFAALDSPLPVLAAKARAERDLAASGMAYTILAPGALMDHWVATLVIRPALAGQPVTVVGSGGRKQAFMAMQDVAAFIQAALENPAMSDRKLALGGPQALSLRQMAGTFEHITGMPIRVQNVAAGDPIPGLPPEDWPLAAYFVDRDAPASGLETAREFGVPLTVLDAFIRRQLANEVVSPDLMKAS